MVEFHVIADYKDRCGEGPIWDVRHNQLYWTDCAGKRFYRYDWFSKEHEVVSEGFEINGFALNRSGGFVCGNSSGIWLSDGSGTPQLVADQMNGLQIRANDCIADPEGRLLVGLCYYRSSGEYPSGKILQVDRDGTPRIIDEGFQLPNGLGFSPDNKTFYFTDSIARTIFAYGYDASTGTVTNRRVFVQVPSTGGLPDGLTVDAEGFVWSAEWYGSRIVRYDPDGHVERSIDTPAKQTTSLTFGGPDLSEIFITSAGEPDSGPVPAMPPGYDPVSGYFGGALYNIRLGIRGKAEFLADIRPGGDDKV